MICELMEITKINRMEMLIGKLCDEMGDDFITQKELKIIQTCLYQVAVRSGNLHGDGVIKIKSILSEILVDIATNPTILIQPEPPVSFCKKLNRSKCQSRANGNTTQEAVFAYILEHHDINFIEKGRSPDSVGMYYIYQPNGSQRCPDFRVFYANSNSILWSIDLDVKQSNTEKIMLNDGWFSTGTIYILSYKSKGSYRFGKRYSFY